MNSTTTFAEAPYAELSILPLAGCERPAARGGAHLNGLPGENEPSSPKGGPRSKVSQRCRQFAALLTGEALRTAIGQTPILFKVMAIILGTVCLLLVGLLWQVQTWQQAEFEELDQEAHVLAAHLATACAPFVRNRDFTTLETILDGAKHASPRIVAVQIRDAGGTRLVGVGPIAPTVQVSQETVPLGDGLGGNITVTRSRTGVIGKLVWLAYRLLATATIVAAFGLAAAWWMARIITRPLRNLVSAAQAVKAGRYDVRVPLGLPDEVGELSLTFNEMTAAIEKNEAVRHQLMRKVIAAAEDERKRVSRELHDHMGPTLGSVIVGLSALETASNKQQVTELQCSVKQAITEAHDLSVALRPSALDDLGLVPALQHFCRAIAARFEVSVDCSAIGLDPATRLPAELEVAFYRISQEALNNAIRHGQASTVNILLQRKDASLLVVIEDDGKGFEAENWRERCQHGDHLGLLGMEERATLFGGTLRLESLPGAGTGLFVEIPLKQPVYA